MSQHDKFLRTSIVSIFEEASNALSALSSSINSFMMREYIMQTIFLKMTGFQEQTMKCLCWERATVDYEYRYERFGNPRGKLGECSRFDEKCSVYGDMIDALKKKDLIDVYNKWQKTFDWVRELQSAIDVLYKAIEKHEWMVGEYKVFREELTNRGNQCFYADGDTIFRNCQNCPKNGKSATAPYKCTCHCLKDVFDSSVYKHRNRCAHNLLSYQVVTPTLQGMLTNNAENTYLMRFAILIAIDMKMKKMYELWSSE